MSGDSYSGWLGGYAKSVAGSVSAFTQDILDETRQDTQDAVSTLKLTEEKLQNSENQRQLLDKEIEKLKNELVEATESKEAAEIQLQEIGNRWRTIVQEKEEELKAAKESLRERGEEGEERSDNGAAPQPAPPTLQTLSRDIDFSDPFQCELEICRLLSENERLSALSQEKSAAVFQEVDVDVEKSGDETTSKIKALERELISVHRDYENELALKDQEIQRLVNTSTILRPPEIDTNDAVDELNLKLSDLQRQLKREQGLFRQLEEEKTRIEEENNGFVKQISSYQHNEAILTEQIQQLQQQELDLKSKSVEYEIRISELEKKCCDALDRDGMVTEQKEISSQLQDLIRTKTEEISGLEVKVQGLEGVISNRDKEINQLRIAISTVQSEEFHEMQGMIDTLKIQVEGYKESLKEAGHNLLTANKLREELGEENARLREGTTRLEDTTHELETALTQVNSMIGEKDASINELQHARNKLSAEVDLHEAQLSSLLKEKNSLQQETNRLKAEKLEAVVDLKAVRESERLLRAEVEGNREVLSRLAQEEEEEDTPAGSVDVGKTDNTSELREKLEGKCEQVQLLQGTLNKVKVAHEEAMLKVREELDDKEVLIAELRHEVDEFEPLLEEVKLLEADNANLKSKIDDLEERCAEQQEQALATAVDDVEKADLQQKHEKLQVSSEKERVRLMSEIERLMEEMTEVEELYSVATADNERLTEEMKGLRNEVNTVKQDRDSIQIKHQKVSDNLKKALARLSVKDAKIDELSDQLARHETKIKSYQDEINFFKHNQTDEIKAAQLGLTSTHTSPEVDQGAVEDDEQPSEDMPIKPTKMGSSSNIEENMSVERRGEGDDTAALRQELFRLQEKCRDKDLKIELLTSEIKSSADASLTTTDTSKLLDQNMALQKRIGVLERETEGIKLQNLELIHQRDYYQNLANDASAELENTKSNNSEQLTTAHNSEKKLIAEIERLQSHLVESEESHTKEFLLATEKEKELRQELAAVREELLTTNSSLHALRSQSEEETDNLHVQLVSVSQQRDKLAFQLSDAEDRVSAAESALTNLQVALEHFQQDKDGVARDVDDRYRREMELLRSKKDNSEKENRRLQERITELEAISQQYVDSKEENICKEEKIKALQNEVYKLDVALKIAQEGLHRARDNSEDKIDRSLIKSFFSHYLTAPENRKPEVLRLITSILNYNEEEMEEIEKNRGNWLDKIFKPIPQRVSPVGPPTGESFSELFVSFLESEANRGSMLPYRTTQNPATMVTTTAANTSTSMSIPSPSLPTPVISHTVTEQDRDTSQGVNPLILPSSLSELLNRSAR